MPVATSLVLLSDSEPDYAEALLAYLRQRLPARRPGFRVELLDPPSGSVPSPRDPDGVGGPRCDLLVYDPESLPQADGWDVVRSGRCLRLVSGLPSRAGGQGEEDGVLPRLGGADRILAAVTARLPDPPSRPPPDAVRRICLLSSLPAAARQALTMGAAERLSARGSTVRHLDLTPMDPDGRRLVPDLLPPLPDDLPSVTDLLLDPDAGSSGLLQGQRDEASAVGPAYLLPPRRADDLHACPPERIASLVGLLADRPAPLPRIVLASCGELPFLAIRDVAAACGRLLLFHADDGGSACHAMRRETSLMLSSLSEGLRFQDLVLPFDPFRASGSDWADAMRTLAEAIEGAAEGRHGEAG